MSSESECLHRLNALAQGAGDASVLRHLARLAIGDFRTGFMSVSHEGLVHLPSAASSLNELVSEIGEQSGQELSVLLAPSVSATAEDQATLREILNSTLRRSELFRAEQWVAFASGCFAVFRAGGRLCRFSLPYFDDPARDDAIEERVLHAVRAKPVHQFQPEPFVLTVLPPDKPNAT